MPKENEPIIEPNSTGQTVKLLTKKEYLDQSLRNLEITSRTAKGTIDTSASAGKKEKIADGLTADKAAQQALSNFKEAIEFLHQEKDKSFENPQQLRGFIEGIAIQINRGITKEGVLIRQEDSPKYPYTKITDLEMAMEDFYSELFRQLQNSNGDPIETAAWIEYRIDLTDHFFADGCGKTAKAISSWFLMKYNAPLPAYRNRKELYENAPNQRRGENSEITEIQYKRWVNYYKSLFAK